MPSLDIIIVAAYLISLAIVGYRAINNFEDQATVQLDQALLKAQLTERGLEQAIAIKVPLKPQYQFEQIADLSLSIVNSSKIPVYVDWDRSSLTNFAGRSRRVVRVTPSMNPDLNQAQIFSVIAPGRTLSERVVAEDMLKRTADGTLQIAAPLVDLAPVRALPEGKQLEFSLRLVLRMIEPGNEMEDDVKTHAVLLRFVVQRVPWDSEMPWKKRKA